MKKNDITVRSGGGGVPHLCGGCGRERGQL